MVYDAIIVGGGPAGLMAANVLSKHQLNFIILEKNDALGKKLLITGGKRSNVTNSLSVSEFIDALDFKHKKFLYPTLTAFGSDQIIDFFGEKGLKFKLEPPIKYFPETEKAKSVLDALLKDIDDSAIFTNQHVIEINKDQETFIVKTKKQVFNCHHLIIATGSKSYPETGSNGDGLAFASSFNIPVKPFSSAETSIYGYEHQLPFKNIKGAQLQDITLYINHKKTKYSGDLIFTHFGLSGPVVFAAAHQIDKMLKEGKVIVSFSLSPMTKDDLIILFNQNQKKYLKNVLSNIIPSPLASYIEKLTKSDQLSISSLNIQTINQIIQLITQFDVEIRRVEDVKRAFVNAGGIDTVALNPKTFESKSVKNLYFIGETVDVFGPIGGFNITIALSSGYASAQSVVKHYKKYH